MSKTKRKAGLIVSIVIVSLIVIGLLGYLGYNNLYRFPSKFRKLDDNSLSAEQTEVLKEKILQKETVNVLVAYFSYSGSTQRVAARISNELSADIFEIIPETEYSNVYMQSNREIRRAEKPKIAQTVDNMENYDIVFVGFPVWWHATPAIINTFMESYNFSDKLIIPFCTSGGSDISEPLPTFLDSCDGLAVYGATRLTGTGEVTTWLNELNLFN